jgi:hypothetical protein
VRTNADWLPGSAALMRADDLALSYHMGWVNAWKAESTNGNLLRRGHSVLNHKTYTRLHANCRAWPLSAKKAADGVGSIRLRCQSELML